MGRTARTLQWPLAAAALSLALAACTDTTQPPPVPEAAAQPEPAESGTHGWGVGPDGELEPLVVPNRGDGEGHRHPIVIATHHTRPPIDITEKLAQRILRGEVDDWSALGQPERKLRLVAAAGTVVPDRFVVRRPGGALAQLVRDRDALAVLPADEVDARVRAVSVTGVDPLRRPADYPLQTEADECPRDVVTMTVVGDIMLGRGVAEAARGSGDPAPALRPMQERLSSASITVGNLESTLSRAGRPTQGDDSFAADPSVVRRLREAGFDVLSLANNHIGDFGDDALVETVRLLQGGAVETFGAGADPLTARNPAILRVGEIRFGFLGFNAIGETPAVAPGRPGAVSVDMPPRTGPYDQRQMDRFLRAVRQLDAEVDVVVVVPHWGTQYTNVPEPSQRRAAQELVGAGADLVVGGHPHWVQGARMIDDALVVHSLGNFVFDMDFMEQTQRGVLLELTYWGSELKAADFVPYQMDDDFAPRVVPWRRGLETLRLMWETGGPAFSRPGS